MPFEAYSDLTLPYLWLAETSQQPISQTLFVAGRDQSAADQPNNLAEGLPPL
jgi:hypothetical protein